MQRTVQHGVAVERLLQLAGDLVTVNVPVLHVELSLGTLHEGALDHLLLERIVLRVASSSHIVSLRHLLEDVTDRGARFDARRVPLVRVVCHPRRLRDDGSTRQCTATTLLLRCQRLTAVRRAICLEEQSSIHTGAQAVCASRKLRQPLVHLQGEVRQRCTGEILQLCQATVVTQGQPELLVQLL